MNLNYKCLILDHDDTVVDSTKSIHYPVFRDVLKILRPEISITSDDFLEFCFDPGFEEYCMNFLNFSRDELNFQYINWKQKTKEHVPDFFPGIKELLLKYKKHGGIITVVSHNDPDLIMQNYIEKTGIQPEMIFGWDDDSGKRKPSTFPVIKILEYFKLKPFEALIIDDLKPGYLMAADSGVDFAFPGWSNHPKKIEIFMKENAKYFIKNINDLDKILFSK
ncbi:MAG: HAD family hydrolase [Spirochaetes bacterium]|nr:HAD family hydrolase [Spirochaetota bacterium]